MATDSAPDSRSTDDRDQKLYSALYVSFGILWGLSLYFDRAPFSVGELSTFDFVLFVAAAGATIVGVLGIYSPDQFAVDDPSRWQFALMILANVAAAISFLFQVV